jgi:hypothetical protein
VQLNEAKAAGPCNLLDGGRFLIDEDPDLDDKRGQGRDDSSCFLGVNASRAGGKDKAERIRTKLYGPGCIFAVCDAADFDSDHFSPLAFSA